MAELRKLDIANLSIEDLEFQISKYSRLRNVLGPKLPDGGAKLTEMLTTLQHSLANRCNSVNSDFVKSFSASNSVLRSRKVYSCDPNSNLMPDPEFTSGQPEETENLAEFADPVGYLSDRLSTMNVDSKVRFESTDLSSIPNLCLNELLDIRQSLGLPNPLLSTFHWFTFLFRFVGNLVYLTVVDCLSTDRHIIRVGLRRTWFPRERTCPVKAEDPKQLSPTPLVSAAEAVRDLWQFVSPTDRAPCLICSSSATGTEPSPLVWLGRLLRTARHSTGARTGWSPECRFVDVIALRSLDSGAEPMGSAIELDLLADCRRLKEAIFGPVLPPNRLAVLPRNFASAREFFQANTTRTLPWMEAPLEWYQLRQLKSVTSMEPFLSSDQPTLSAVPDTLLRRLAAVGLGRTRLTRLAGEPQSWHRFAGLLGFRLSEQASPFVTDCLPSVQQLYRFFRHVASNLDRHLRLVDEPTPFSRSNPARPVPIPSRRPPPKPDRTEPWISSGITSAAAASSSSSLNGARQLCVLDMDSSIELMRQVQARFQEARKVHNLSNYPTLPPPSAQLGSYRSARLAFDESDDAESDSASSDEDSLHLEDPD